MIDKQTLEGWAGEIRTELTGARQELADRSEALRAAQDVADAARAEQVSTQLQLAALRQPMAFRLAARIRAIGDDASTTAAEVTSIRNVISLLREKVADLQEAQHQVGVLLAALTPSTEGEEATQEQADAVG